MAFSLRERFPEIMVVPRLLNLGFLDQQRRGKSFSEGSLHEKAIVEVVVLSLSVSCDVAWLFHDTSKFYGIDFLGGNCQHRPSTDEVSEKRRGMRDEASEMFSHIFPKVAPEISRALSSWQVENSSPKFYQIFKISKPKFHPPKSQHTS